MEKSSVDLEKQVDFSNLELLANQVVEGFITGLHKSPFHGFSVEFAEHRLYNKGNSIKNIDWKLYARTEKLFVKCFEEETNLRCHLLIDHSASMFYPDSSVNKFQFSALAASAIINLLKRQRDAFGLTVFSDEVELHTDARSTTTHQKLILQELSKRLVKSEKTRKTDIAGCLHAIAEKIHKRSLVVLFTDMFDNSKSTDQLEKVFSALQHLKFANNEIIVFNVHDRKHELNFDFENRPYHFIDLEGEGDLKLNPSQYKELYLSKVAEFNTFISTKCAQLSINLVNADIENGYFPILNSWLIARAKRSGRRV